MTNDTYEYVSPQEDTVWSAVFVTEFIAMFIINAFALITFAKNRHLRKRSNYLIINLAVADFLVAAVIGPLNILLSEILERNLELGEGFSWESFIIWGFNNLFVVASLANISLISLERLHATVYPFRHCLIGEWAYFKIILCSWFIALLLTLVLAYLALYVQVAVPYAFASFLLFPLLILTVSYVMIISNVKSNPHSQKFGAMFSEERKLTVTLFTVIVTSFSTMLPSAIVCTIPRDIWSKLSPAKVHRISDMTFLLRYANSIVNPLIYAIRMEVFRRAAKELVCKRTPESMGVQPIELSTM